MYTAISEAIHLELEKMEDKYANGATLTMSDLDAVDKMFHALKCLSTYEAMDEANRRPTRSRYGYDRRY